MSLNLSLGWSTLLYNWWAKRRRSWIKCHSIESRIVLVCIRWRWAMPTKDIPDVTLFTLHCCRNHVGLAREWFAVIDLDHSERTCDLDIGAFLHCKELKGSLRALGVWYCESNRIAENIKVEADSTTARVGNLRPAWTFDMTLIRIFVTQVRAQHRVTTKIHDKQALR